MSTSRALGVLYASIVMCGIAVVGLVPTALHAAVIWNWDGTDLTGARNVDVSGVLYDVTFEDGTCSSVFAGCDNPLEDFAFTTSPAATAAANALRDQVFLDSPAGGSPSTFDTSPWETWGCSSTISCTTFIPYALFGTANVSVTQIRNNASPFQTDLVGLNTVPLTLDTTSDTTYNYAVFTLASVSIPAPVWLFGSGLAGIIGISRRRKAA